MLSSNTVVIRPFKAYFPSLRCTDIAAIGVLGPSTTAEVYAFVRAGTLGCSLTAYAYYRGRRHAAGADAGR